MNSSHCSVPNPAAARQPPCALSVETPDKGQVLFDGKDITALPPNERDLNTVFQKYALFPHMSIAENIAFGLKIRKKARHTSTTKSNTP